MFTPTIRSVLLAALAAGATACSTLPEKTGLLDRTHADYMAAQADPNVGRYAPLEMKRAGDALAAADGAAAQHEGAGKIDQLAYLAKQQIAVAMEVAKEKMAVAEQESAKAQLEQIRLAQRTQEAEKAKRSADQSQREAQVARGDAAEAQRAADAAKAKNAQLEAELADLSAKQTARGMVITFGDLLFGTDQANLTPDGMRTAHKVADILLQHPERTVLVEGYTDSTGSAKHNQELSERRAGSVRKALQEMGVGANRINARGYGQSNPVASNATAAERQLNRRVEIVLSDENGKSALR